MNQLMYVKINVAIKRTFLLGEVCSTREAYRDWKIDDKVWIALMSSSKVQEVVYAHKWNIFKTNLYLDCR